MLIALERVPVGCQYPEDETPDLWTAREVAAHQPGTDLPVSVCRVYQPVSNGRCEPGSLKEQQPGNLGTVADNQDAVIGDGAMTAGQAFEGLNNAGIGK